MGYKTITKNLDVTHYLQADSRWKDKVLSSKIDDVLYSSTIGKIGCAMTSGAMVANITPGTLWDKHKMTDYLCDWTKIPTHTFTTHSISSTASLNTKLFSEIVLNDNPVIVYGDDGTGSIYSTHFAVVYGFSGTVAVDSEGGYSLANYDLHQFKVFDPSTVSGYGNHVDVFSFNDRFPVKSLRLTDPK